MAPSTSLVSKLKVQLKLAISRLRMVQQKDSAIAKQQRRAMAALLETGKEASARIRVENIIQSDIHTELLEILELYCELLLARSSLLENTSTFPPPSGAQHGSAVVCDPGLEEAIKSIIYAAPRTEIRELHEVRKLLVEKYGKEFATTAAGNTDGKVGERVVRKLEVKMPSAELVEGYLAEIARAYGVEWPRQPASTSDADGGDDAGEGDEGDGGGTKEKEPPLEVIPGPDTSELDKATPPRDAVGGPKSPVIKVAPRRSSTDNVGEEIRLPKAPDLKPGAGSKGGGGGGKVGGGADGEEAPSTAKTNGNTSEGPGAGAAKKNTVGGKIPDVDELAKRFAALKR